MSLRIFTHLASASIRSQMSYRRSFLLEVAGRTLITTLELVAVFFMFEQIDTLGGWSRAEVIYLFGVASICLGLGETVSSGLDDMPELVRTGAFDQLMVRPVSPLLQMLGREVKLYHIGRLIQGVVALAIAFHGLELHLGMMQVGMLLLSIICGTVIYTSLFIAGAANCFWSVQSNEMFNAFTYGGVQMTQFPVTIYQPWLRNLFLYGIPVGFASYFPALVVLQKPDVLGLGPFVPYLTPIVALAFLAVCLGFWRLGMHHYQSTGS